MDNRFYPFTEIHPYRPWYHRIRILTLGESVLENQERLRIRDNILRDASQITLADTRASGSMTPASAVGIGVKPVGVGFTGMLETAQTWAKINSVPHTPTHMPVSTSTLPEFMGGSLSWDSAKRDQIAESKTIKGKGPLTNSPIPVLENLALESSSGESSPSVTNAAVKASGPVSGQVSPSVAGNASGQVFEQASVNSSPENDATPATFPPPGLPGF